jgi:hypothetical protein
MHSFSLAAERYIIKLLMFNYRCINNLDYFNGYIIFLYFFIRYLLAHFGNKYTKLKKQQNMVIPELDKKGVL